MKPKILIIDNSIDVTGALKSITRTAYDLRDDFDFYFIIPKNSKGRYWIETKGFVNIYELPFLELSRRPISLIFYWPMLLINAFRLQIFVKKNSIDLIHVNDIYNLTASVLRIFKAGSIYICHIRFLPNKFPPLLFKFWFIVQSKFSYKIIGVSQSVIRQLPAHPNVILIHNELPVEERYTDRVKTIEDPVFLYLANFMEGKGQNFALEAFAKISSLYPDWRLRFVGGDMGLKKNEIFKNNLIAKAEAMGILKKIDWKGFTDDVELEYKKADIVLNFSESESFSITCLEALFFGKPLIATDCGGPSELIENMETGILVPNRDVEAMVEAMILLVQDIEFRRRIGLNARDVVKVKFSIDNTSMKLKNVYKAALKQKYESAT
jgi:glycosyltransferase involved in cell wall biosynthesis